MGNGSVDSYRVMGFGPLCIVWAQVSDGSQGRGKKSRGKTAQDRETPAKAQKRTGSSSDPGVPSCSFREKDGGQETGRATGSGAQAVGEFRGAAFDRFGSIGV